MPELFVTDRAGAEKTIALEPTGTLMTLIRDADVEDMFGICGGACSCSTCHVIIDPEWFDRIGAPQGDEVLVLQATDHLAPTSRLACQVRLNPGLDGLRLTVAAEG